MNVDDGFCYDVVSVLDAVMMLCNLTGSSDEKFMM